MNNQINMAIQVLPVTDHGIRYEIVDQAIDVIAASGFRYKVCPFETVVECSLEEGLGLVRQIHASCAEAGTLKMLTYLKIQSDFTKDVTIEDKMEKYE